MPSQTLTCELLRKYCPQCKIAIQQWNKGGKFCNWQYPECMQTSFHHPLKCDPLWIAFQGGGKWKCKWSFGLCSTILFTDHLNNLLNLLYIKLGRSLDYIVIGKSKRDFDVCPDSDENNCKASCIWLPPVVGHPEKQLSPGRYSYF